MSAYDPTRTLGSLFTHRPRELALRESWNGCMKVSRRAGLLGTGGGQGGGKGDGAGT
jgi:hypothetical protein